jgi:hypothetical protein
MKFRLFAYWFAVVNVFVSFHVLAQLAPDNVIQIDGVTMTADSLRAVSDVVVEVKGKNRGTETEYTGVFSMVCEKGDTLRFSCTGFRTKEYVIPKDIKGDLFSMIQLMVQDTFYLPETIIRPLPSKERFNYAFQHWHIPNDQYELARRNTNSYMLRALAYTMPMDGHLAQSRELARQANAAVYYGQQQPMNILNPIAWGQFFEAWKRGDFRKQSNPYLDDSNY